MQSKKVFQTALIIILALVAVKFFMIPLKMQLEHEAPFMVRVRLAHDAKSLDISSRSACKITDLEKNRVLDKRMALPEGTKAFASVTGIKVGDKDFSSSRIRVSARGRGITLNGKPYRGQIDIVKTDDAFQAVNTIEMEDYLKGVVSQEMNRFWPFETLKAQAIASRSYAAYRVLNNKNKDYDLTNDTFSQVYGGRSSERWRTSKAVEATKGKVLEYNGKLLPAYFHSCCGGYTEDARRMWGEDIKPLRGVRCPWCRWSPHFRWQVKVPTQTIEEKLTGGGYPVKRVDDIRIGPYDKSRRPDYIRVKADNKWLEIKTGSFCSIIGRKTLRSEKFKVKKYPLFYVFSGYGWGHGVGLCQWGAFGLGVRRWNEEKILRYYYPDTKITDIKEVKP